jgi:hypothetical protein
LTIFATGGSGYMGLSVDAVSAAVSAGIRHFVYVSVAARSEAAGGTFPGDPG